MKHTTTGDELLAPCPFCGGPAEIEETSLLGAVRKSAGCQKEQCQGYQSTLTFATKREAVSAWNIRHGMFSNSRFEEIKLALRNAPLSWLPALLIRIVQLCHVRQVFADKECLRRTVERAMQETIR